MIDLRAVMHQGFRDLNITDLPPLLRPAKGKLGLTDYEKVFSPDLKNNQNIYDLRRINRETGCVVIVRPDQYVANVLPLDDHDALAGFFDGVLLKP